MNSKLFPLVHYLDSLEGQADLDRLQTLLSEISVKRADLGDFVRFSDEAYRRNVISHSPQYDLLAICWRPGQHSQIHDHHGSSCAFKIIEGRATEVVFTKTGGEESNLVRPTSSRDYERGEICVSASSHIHEVLNLPQGNQDLITLHIYSPPLSMRMYERDPAHMSTESSPSFSEGPRVSR